MSKGLMISGFILLFSFLNLGVSDAQQIYHPPASQNYVQPWLQYSTTLEEDTPEDYLKKVADRIKDFHTLDCFMNVTPNLAPMINATSGKYEESNAYALALLSAMSYDVLPNDPAHDVVNAKLATMGFKNIRSLEVNTNKMHTGVWKEIKGLAEGKLKANPEELRRFKNKIRVVFADTRILFAETDSYIVLVFAGTDMTSGDNLWSDFFKLMTNQNDLGRVHAGFMAATKVIWEPLMKELAKYDHAKPLLITGGEKPQSQY